MLGKNEKDESNMDKTTFGDKYKKELNYERLCYIFTIYDIKRMESYTKNFIDYHAIIDLTPKLAYLYFSDNVGNNISLSPAQATILLGIGLQHKNVDEISEQIGIKPHQTLSMFLKVARKFVAYFRRLEEREEEKKNSPTNMSPKILK